MRLHKRALGTSIKYLYNRYLLNNFGHFRNFIVSFLFYHRFLLYPLKASNSLSLSLCKRIFVHFLPFLKAVFLPSLKPYTLISNKRKEISSGRKIHYFPSNSSIFQVKSLSISMRISLLFCCCHCKCSPLFFL